MKTIFTKNVAIVALCLSTLISWAFIGLHWNKLYPTKVKITQRSEPPTENMDSYRSVTVLGAIRTRSSELQRCYDAYLVTEPTVTSGFIRVNWSIDSYGAVTSVSTLDSQFDDTSFTNCVLEQIQAWSFSPPPSEEAMNIAHKFTFKNQASKVLSFEN